MAKSKKPVLREVELAAEPLPASQHFPPIKPAADGQMPLSAAVHWIASKGFKNDHDLTSQEGQLAYSAAAIDLLAKISDDKVHAFGENSDEDPEQLPAAQFSQLASYFDFTDDFEAAGNDRRMEINVSEEGQSRDVLRKAGKRGHWTAVRVSCEDVSREWPVTADGSDELFDLILTHKHRGPKAERTRRALLCEFRNGRVPRHLSIPQICERISSKMKAMGERGGADHSTIGRLIGRKK
jgi:hypothetical protein